MAFEKWSPIVVLFLAALFLLLGWLARDPAEPEFDGEPQSFDQHLAEAYVQAGCWQCHSVSTLDDELTEAFGRHAAGVRPVGPDLAGVGTRYHPDWHRAHFWNPGDVFADSLMPAQRHLFAPGEPPRLNGLGERVTQFLLTLKSPSRFTRPWPQTRQQAPAGDSQQGAALFNLHCAGCHGENGAGNGPAAVFFERVRKPPALADGELIMLRDDEPPVDTIYTIITNGLPLSAMPSFNDRMSDQERADIAAWVVKISGR
jgi:mono/diheme cytochrome c family protein